MNLARTPRPTTQVKLQIRVALSHSIHRCRRLLAQRGPPQISMKDYPGSINYRAQAGIFQRLYLGKYRVYYLR